MDIDHEVVMSPLRKGLPAEARPQFDPVLHQMFDRLMALEHEAETLRQKVRATVSTHDKVLIVGANLGRRTLCSQSTGDPLDNFDAMEELAIYKQLGRLSTADSRRFEVLVASV